MHFVTLVTIATERLHEFYCFFSHLPKAAMLRLPKTGVNRLTLKSISFAMKLTSRLFVVAVVFIFASAYTQQMALAQGVMLRSIGAVNASVGGTATAMPLDASGALYWNPASISALKQNEMTFGLELVLPQSKVESSVLGRSGSTKGEAGVTPVPSMGFVWSTCPKSPFTYGIGMAAVGGAASLYPHDVSNPILKEHGKSATVIILQVTPTVSAQLTRRMSVGFAPIVDLASLNINPMTLGSDVRAPLSALTTYGTRYIWGAGFQVGTLYDFENNFKAGFMFKSPIWAEKLYFTGTDGNENPASTRFHLNLPMTLSAGISYDGFRDTVIGMDVRYLDYGNTAGLRDGVNTSTGRVDGLDWESVFSINLGMERKINHRLKVRLGYCWNENPIPNRSAYLCVSAPMMTQHVFSCGFSFAFAKNLELSTAYAHAFKAKQTGVIPGEDGGTVTNVLSSDALFVSLTKKW